MRFWQRRLLGMVADGQARPVEHASDGWPAVEEREWPDLVDAYLAGLEQLRDLARDGSQLEKPVREGLQTTVGYQIVSHFAHEAHHLGQIILLRRLQGAWPPAGGGDSW